jgi:hypothetical protein
LDSGEDAEALGFDGTTLTMLSPRAYAPGAPIHFSATTDEDARNFEGRAIGSKRVDDGRFEVRMRFVNLRRADRELLSGRLAN